MFSKIHALLTLCVVAAVTTLSHAQNNGGKQLGQDSTRRAIPTAVPFLTITPDARSAGMGDVGVAVSSDANATYWNPSKLAFSEKSMGFAISYSPWLAKLVPDMSLSYLSGYKRLSKQEVIAVSLRYFDMGKMQFTDKNGNPLQDFNPRELAIDASYSRALSKTFSIAGTARFIHSNLAGSISNGSNVNSSPGNTAAVDISIFYTKKDVMLGGVNSTVNFGANLSNIGAKITYNAPENKDFIPTNLRLGTAITGELDPYNKLTFALDFNKLLVPTPPIVDSKGMITKGKDPNRTLISGIMGSFGDAPGGVKEELQEVMISAGLEYWYNSLLAVRGGYFYEHRTKGNRKYATLGVGLRYQAFGLDFAYMIPQQQNNPLADTMRFTLLFDLNSSKQEKSVEDASE